MERGRAPHNEARASIPRTQEGELRQQSLDFRIPPVTLRHGLDLSHRSPPSLLSLAWDEPVSGTSWDQTTLGTSQDELLPDTSQVETVPETSRDEAVPGASQDMAMLGAGQDKAIPGTSQSKPAMGVGLDEAMLDTSLDKPMPGMSDKPMPEAGQVEMHLEPTLGMSLLRTAISEKLGSIGDENEEADLTGLGEPKEEVGEEA